MTPDQIVEATLFASQTPLTAAELARADDDLDPKLVTDVVQTLRDRYEEHATAFQIYQLGDGYQLLTRPEFAPYLERFDSVSRAPSLSRAALETLAIVAYRQPIGRIEIEEVRGVSASSVLRTLMEWELIEVVGRGEGLGRPLLYGVSAQFLDHFGFKDLAELPDPELLPVSLRELTVDESAGLGRSSAAPPEQTLDDPSDEMSDAPPAQPEPSVTASESSADGGP